MDVTQRKVTRLKDKAVLMHETHLEHTYTDQLKTPNNCQQTTVITHTFKNTHKLNTSYYNVRSIALELVWTSHLHLLVHGILMTNCEFHTRPMTLQHHVVTMLSVVLSYSKIIWALVCVEMRDSNLTRWMVGEVSCSSFLWLQSNPKLTVSNCTCSLQSVYIQQFVQQERNDECIYNSSISVYVLM